MFEPQELPELRRAIKERALSDKKLLDDLRTEVRAISGQVRRIQPRVTTAVSLVASDGGNNKLAFDPFYVQLVRVVDSYGKQLCLDAVSPTTDLDELSQAQFNEDGSAKTALGQLMQDLEINPPTLRNLSHMMPPPERAHETPGWVLTYRDLCEWAVLYERICHRTFATDTLIVRDGLLRSKLFRGDNFIKFRRKLEESIERIYREDRRRVYLVGLAKHSQVLERYHLAMAIENVFPFGEPRYVSIPRPMEAKAYKWPEYARGVETEENGGGEAPKFVAGDMFFVRFGSKRGDPIWIVDIFSSQKDQAAEIFGYLLADSIDGFPVPYYPRCLQKAHEYAQIVDFDLEILQDEVYSAVREILPDERKDLIDVIRLGVDVSARRYE